METARTGHRFRVRALSIFFVLFASMAAMGLPEENPEARPSGRPVYWWFGASLGAGFIFGGETENLVLGGVNLTAQWGKIFVSLCGSAGVNPSDDRTSVGGGALMVGHFKRKERSAWSAGAGIGYVDMYPPSKPPFKGIAVPLEVRYSWFFSSSAALTVAGLVNFNGGASYAGLTVGIQLGRVRARGA